MILKYVLFAVLSTLFNLLFQFFSLLIYDQIYGLYLAMFIGTLAGLICKYILDKKYIFYYQTQGHQDNLKTFIFYAFTGIFTTAIFWSTELFFNMTFNLEYAKYLGAILGLSMGYLLKYQLDKVIVFNEQKI